MTKQQLKRKYYAKNFDYCCYIGSSDKCNHYLNPRRTQKLFRKWLGENLHRFIHKPYCNNRQYREFHFEGVTENITFVINYSNAEAMLFYENPFRANECSDHSVIEYIGCAEYDPKYGYYDADREDGNFTYYPTKEEVIVNEVFEKIIPYVNKRFTKENVLSIFEAEGWVSSDIRSRERYEKERDEMLAKPKREWGAEWFVFDIFSGELIEKMVFSTTAT